MKMTIDGRSVRIAPSDSNIIDVADRAKIAIPCACYRIEKRKGCCRACVVDVDGKERYACSTAPAHGMNVVVARADLKALRQQRMFAHE